MHPDTFYHIALTQTPLIGSVNAKNLVAYCGGVREVFELKKKDLMSIEGVGPKIAESIHTGEGLRSAEREMRFLEGTDIRPIFFLNNEYPQRLLDIYNAPVLIYFNGSDDRLLQHERIVAVVGTRKPTHNGKQICEQLVEGLKPHNCLIVSGLAFGIDIVAHKTSVENSMPTIGVLGHGLGRIYDVTEKSAVPDDSLTIRQRAIAAWPPTATKSPNALEPATPDRLRPPAGFDRRADGWICGRSVAAASGPGQ